MLNAHFVKTGNRSQRLRYGDWNRFAQISISFLSILRGSVTVQGAAYLTGMGRSVGWGVTSGYPQPDLLPSSYVVAE